MTCVTRFWFSSLLFFLKSYTSYSGNHKVEYELTRITKLKYEFRMKVTRPVLSLLPAKEENRLK